MAYRVLALDGGGTWALVQVLALIELYDEKATGHDVLSDFDLAAATSGGSIVLGGLVENVTLSALLNFFMDQTARESIFSPTSKIFDRVLEGLLQFGPKYSAKRKLPALERLLPTRGTTPLTNCAAGVRRPVSDKDVHLLITAFDYDRSRASFFRSATVSSPIWGEGASATVTLAEAIHASSNAPVMYFDEAAGFPGQTYEHYWDGAISGCNNPVMAAVTEAISLDIAPTDIAALSLGTGNLVLPFSPAAPDPPFTQGLSATGLVSDLQKLAGAICDDPPDVASFIAYVMTGGSVDTPPAAGARVVRMNPLIRPIAGAGGWIPPGNWSIAQFEHLAGLHMDATLSADVQCVSDYAHLWLSGAAINQPIRMDGQTLVPEIGHDTFQKAAQAWKAIR